MVLKAAEKVMKKRSQTEGQKDFVALNELHIFLKRDTPSTIEKWQACGFPY
jgi:hypothetical protein